jgi:hypothetical protein
MEIKQKVATKDADKTISIVPSHESEMSCARSIDFTSFLDFGTAHTVWYFLFLILFQCSLLLFVCALGFKKQ